MASEREELGERIDEIVRRLRERLEAEPDVLFAYLFGSVARGRAGPLSDVDVAVMVKDGVDLARRHLDLIGAVSEAVGSDGADVVLLNEAPISLAFRVIRDGVVILSLDEKARIRHKAMVIDRYIDMAPMRKELARGLRHRLEEGRFGRP
jgi:predicted nucleotidyltransferase